MITKHIISEATAAALLRVTESRFYATERGFHGYFYHFLYQELETRDLLTRYVILEPEPQKKIRSHKTRLRPDIILHMPTEHTQEAPDKNNFALWAFKKQASKHQALEDFNKMDVMFQALNYQFGIFININAKDTWIESYVGKYADRLITFATRLVNGQPNIFGNY